jgi:uncharacterized protein YutD
MRENIGKRKNGNNSRNELNLDEMAPTVATYGHYCRSTSFMGFADEVWMEALQITPGVWSLREVRCEISNDEDGKAHQRGETQIVASNQDCTLLEALRSLYNFEQTYKNNASNYIQITRPEELGFDHYVAFGQRETFAFDNTGKPLITLNGHIVEGENIDYQTIVKVREAWAEKQLLFMSEADDLLPHFNLSLDEKDLDTFLISIHNRDFINDLHDAFEDAIKSFDKLVDDKSTNALHTHGFFTKLRQLNNTIEGQFPQNDGHDAPNTSAEYLQVLNRLKQYVMAMELHGRLYVAKESFTRAFNRKAGQQTASDIQLLKGDIIKAAQDIQRQYIALGNEPVKLEQIQAEIIRLNRPYGHVLEARPKAFRIIMKTLDDMKTRSTEIASELRKEALKAKHRDEIIQNEARKQFHLGSYMADRIKPKFR